MTAEQIKKIETLLDDPVIRDKISNSESLSDFVAILSEYGVDASEEDFMKFAEDFKSGELSDEMLELVAGGGKFKDFWWGFCDGLCDGWNSTKKFFCSLFK